ncbi:hypothetical protein AAHC03_016418 [Spirometra sp. Aus1]
MAEVADLYYGIAAPFKAVSKHNKKHAQQMQACFEKAIRRGFVSPSVRRGNQISLAPAPAASTNGPQPSPPSEASEDPFEAELEHHLSGMLGEEQAKRLLSGVKRGRPPSLFSKKNLLYSDTLWPNSSQTAKAGNSNGSDGQPVSSDYSSVCDGDRAPPSRSSRFNLPSGIHYDHEEFLKFLATPLSELEENRLTEMAKLRPLDKELQSAFQAVDLQGQTVLSGLENYLPHGGFPKVAYRWTKMELALFLTALSKLGDDFAAISRTLGTKSESFIRDFYEEFKEKAGLDSLVKPRLKPEPAEAEQKLGQQQQSSEPSRKPAGQNEHLGVEAMTELQLPDMSVLPHPQGGGPDSSAAPAAAAAAKPEEKAVATVEVPNLPKRPTVQSTAAAESDPPVPTATAPSAPKKSERAETEDETSLENVVRAKNTLVSESTALRLPPPQRGKRGRPRKHPIREEQQRQLVSEHAPAKRLRTLSASGNTSISRNAVGSPVQRRGKRGRPPLRRG